MVSKNFFKWRGNRNRTYTKVDLERVVNQPLEGGKSTDHDNSHRKTVPQTLKANVAIDSAHSLGSTLASLAVRVELGNHDIGRMRDGSTSNTSNVTTEEGDTGLCKRTVAVLGLAKVAVNLVDCSLKGRKLDHGIWDLSGPERIKTLVEASETLLLHDSAPSCTEGGRVRWDVSLHADLERLEGTEEDVGDELGSSGSTKVDKSLVGVWKQLLAVVVLEDFVCAVLAGALERVTNKGGSPSGEDASDSFFGSDLAPGLHVGFVEFVIDLTSTFYKIERGDCGVSRSTGWSGLVS